MLALVNALVCLGLNVQWGQTGLFNVGVAGFVAIGAYASALLTTPPTKNRLGGFALPILRWLARRDDRLRARPRLFVGALTLRLRADYLAITTFGVAVVVQLVALNAQGLTGGAFGVAFIPRPFDKPRVDSGAVRPCQSGAGRDRRRTASIWGWSGLGAVPGAVCCGRSAKMNAPRWRSARIRRVIRLQAFALGGALMGLAGAIGAHFIGFIAPENYTSTLTFQVWTMLIVGGAGNNLGAVIGAVLVWALWSGSGIVIADLVPASFEARAAALRIITIGVLLATMIVVRPRGLLGEKAMVSRHLDEE